MNRVLSREDNTFRDITAYLDFLREKGYAVSVCGFAPELLPYLPVLYQYEAHMPGVCVYLKSRPATRKRCVAQKRLLLANLPGEIRYGCCYAGVEEFLVPIFAEDGRIIICVNIAGYRGNLRRSDRQYRRLERKLETAYRQSYQALSETPPSLKEVRAMTAPLAYMFRVLYAECCSARGPESTSEQLYRQMLEYFYAYYPQEDAFSAVCRKLHYSEVDLRRLFREKSGTTPGAFLSQLRMRRAAELLRSTDQPVAVVAASCGFEDPNYFSASFRRCYGQSPRAYRKEK